MYSVEASELILKALSAVLDSNNGYAVIGNNPAVIEGCKLAGLTVIVSTDLHGNRTHKAFTKAAQEALKAGDGFSTYKPFKTRQDEPDYEGMILDRQANEGFYD